MPSTPRHTVNHQDAGVTNAAEKALLSFLLGLPNGNNNTDATNTTGNKYNYDDGDGDDDNSTTNNKNDNGTPSTAEKTPLLDYEQDRANVHDHSFGDALGEMDESDRAFGAPPADGAITTGATTGADPTLRHADRGGFFGFSPTSWQNGTGQERLVDRLLETAQKREPRGILPKDVYSLIVAVKPWSNGFWVVCCTVLVQIIVLVLISVDSISLRGDDEYPTNLLGVPATSELQVTLAQFLALTIASLSQYDVVQAIILYNVGYEPEQIQACINDARLFHPEYMRTRWFASLALRFCIGFSTIVVTFMLVSQSETVRDVMLDFTAIEFVSQLDEIVFILISFGFFGRKVKQYTDLPLYDDRAMTRDNKMTAHIFRFKWMNKTVVFFFRTIAFWVNIGLLMYIAVRQYTGRYVPDTVLVQMGDDRDPLLSTYTGIYDLRRPRLGWITYSERGGSGLFAWCEEERAWTFLKSDDLDCSTQWSIKSTEMANYADMLTIANDPWFVLEENNIRLQVDHLRIASMRGIDIDCQDSSVEAESMVFGWTCRFSDPCTRLAVDAIAGPFQGQRTWPTQFDILENILVYQHPVYYHRGSSDQNPDLIFFTGRQWVMLSTASWWGPENQDTADVYSDDDIREILRGFRVYDFDRNLGVRFLSELVDLGTKNDKGTPTGLQWFAAELGGGAVLMPDAESRLVVEQQFYCGVCISGSENRDCLFGAPCVDGTCVCDGKNLGSRCEVVPSNDAICNPSFNRPEFDFDGGDCCASTCVDTPTQPCLKSADHLIDYGNSLCRTRQAPFERQLPLTVPDFVGTVPNAMPVAPGITFSQDGRSFALSYRTTEDTTLITKVGTSWTRWGISHQFGGYHNDIVSLFPGSVGGPERRLPIKGVAASFVSRGITPYVCDGLGCDAGRFLDTDSTLLPNSVVPPDFELADYWDPFSVSDDGNVLARGAYLADSGRYVLDIYIAESILGWRFSGERIDLTINRTEVVGTYYIPVEETAVPTLAPSSSPTISPTLVPTNNVSTFAIDSTESLVEEQEESVTPVPACQFLAEYFNLTTWSDEDLINNFPLFDLGNLTTQEFVVSVSDIDGRNFDIGQFNATEYIWVNCLPELVAVPLFGPVKSASEAPIYVSLSRQRPDGTRRVAVGSIKFENRTRELLTTSLATRVYEISSTGTVNTEVSHIHLIDQSYRHGKGTSNAVGIPKKAVSISRDGNTLVIGSVYLREDDVGTYEAAVVKVFCWIDDRRWELIQEIELGRSDPDLVASNGWSNMLSEDGGVLAVSYPSKSAVYRWNGTSYVQNSQEVPFASGTDVSVSPDGSIVGFAAPLRGGFGAFLYRNDAAPWCAKGVSRELRMSYTPLSRQNFTWELHAPKYGEDDRILAQGGWPAPLALSAPLVANRQSPSRTKTDLSGRRHLQLEVEQDYDMDDPTMLTFVETLCVPSKICSRLFLEEPDDLPGVLGVIFDGTRITSNADIKDEIDCKFEFSFSLA